MRGSLRRSGKAILTLIRLLACLSLLIMMVLTFIDVIGRYIFNEPVFGAAEMIQFLLAGSVFAGLVLVSQKDGHVAVELISPLIERRIPRIHRVIVSLTTALGLGLICFEMMRLALHAFELSRVSIVLEWHYGWVLVPAVIFTFVATVVQVFASKDSPP